MKKIIFTALAGILMTGCQSTGPTIVAKKQLIAPAKVKQMSSSKSLAIMPVEADSEYLPTDVLTQRLESHLGSIKENEQNRFNISDKANADTLLVVDYKVDSVKSNSGDLGGGTVSCVKPATDAKQARTSCVSWTRKPERCTLRKTKVDFMPKLISAADGKVLLEKTYTVVQGSRFCMDANDKRLATAGELADDAFATILQRFSADIAAHEVDMEIPLINKDDADLSDDKLAIFADAMNVAKSGDIEKACNKFTQGVTKLTESPAYLYNVGVCYEIQGDAKQAKSYYEKALEMAAMLSNKDKKLVVSAISRH